MDVFELLEVAAREERRRQAAAKIATMPEWEKMFVLGLFRHETGARGDAGLQDVIDWLAERKEDA